MTDKVLGKHPRSMVEVDPEGKEEPQKKPILYKHASPWYKFQEPNSKKEVWFATSQGRLYVAQDKWVTDRNLRHILDAYPQDSWDTPETMKKRLDNIKRVHNLDSFGHDEKFWLANTFIQSVNKINDPPLSLSDGPYNEPAAKTSTRWYLAYGIRRWYAVHQGQLYRFLHDPESEEDRASQDPTKTIDQLIGQEHHDVDHIESLILDDDFNLEEHEEDLKTRQADLASGKTCANTNLEQQVQWLRDTFGAKITDAKILKEMETILPINQQTVWRCYDNNNLFTMHKGVLYWSPFDEPMNWFDPEFRVQGPVTLKAQQVTRLPLPAPWSQRDCYVSPTPTVPYAVLHKWLRSTFMIQNLTDTHQKEWLRFTPLCYYPVL